MISPVLRRELQATGRQAGTYWLRVLAGVALCIFLLGMGIGEWFRWGGTGSLPAAVMGGILLTAFHAALMSVFLFVSPVATADLLARERREGTLGLLFLTPLTSSDVVAGKMIAQVLRIFGLWVAVLPFLAIPMMLGGVGPASFLRALGAELAVVFTGLAAGFVAAGRARTWLGGVSAAALWMVLFLAIDALVCLGTFLIVANGIGAGNNIPLEAWPAIPFGVAFSVAGGILRAPGFAVPIGVGIPPWMQTSADAALTVTLVFSALLFAGAVALTAWMLTSERHKERVGSGDRLAAAPEKERRHRRRWRSWLESNPIAWMEMGSLELRRTRRAILAGAGLMYAGLLANRIGLLSSNMWDDALLMPWIPLFLVFEALMAAGSFRREIEEGTLEILLVTPLKPAKLVRGRHLALLSAVGPGFALALLLTLLTIGTEDGEAWSAYACLTLSTMLSLPMVGMRCAMRRMHPMAGWALTLAWGVAVPGVVAGFLVGWLQAMSWVRNDDLLATVFCALAIALQWIGAIWWGKMTAWDLESRAYQLRPLARRGARP